MLKPDRPSARVIRALRSRTALQAGLNAVSTGLVSVLSAVFTAVAAHHLTVERLGSLQFALSLLQFVALFFEFGISLPASRLAARTDRENGHRVVAATLVAFAPIGLAFSLLMFGLSFTIDQWSHVHVASALRVTAIVTAVYPFQLISQQLCQGLDRLHVASVTSVLGQLAGLVGLIYVVVSGPHLTAEVALLVRSLGMLVGSVLLIAWLGPRFVRIKPALRRIVSETRQYGFAIYIGRVLSVATYNMDVLMLGILSTARAVAMYTLADALARGVILLPLYGANAALFPRMVHQDFIPKSWIRLSYLTGAIGVGGLVLVAPYVIDFAFSSRYHDAVRYIVPLGAAEAVRGVTLVYNTWLGAQARGRELRNAGLVLTGSNLVLNFALIPPFGATGAAWASLAALVANLGAHVHYYRRTSKRRGEPSSPTAA